MFLGMVASVGLLGMIGSLLVRSPCASVAPREMTKSTTPTVGTTDVRPLLTVLTLVAILVATMGGLAWFFAIAGFTEMRGWNRISTLSRSLRSLGWC